MVDDPIADVRTRTVRIFKQYSPCAVPVHQAFDATVDTLTKDLVWPVPTVPESPEHVGDLDKETTQSGEQEESDPEIFREKS